MEFIIVFESGKIVYNFLGGNHGKKSEKIKK
jgi:hypothetical protein